MSESLLPTPSVTSRVDGINSDVIDGTKGFNDDGIDTPTISNNQTNSKGSPGTTAPE